MAQINKPNTYFNTVLYTGNSTDNTAITGINFQPDLVWIRNRSIVENHLWQDSVRGATGGEYYYIQSNTTAGDQTQGDGDGVVSLDSDGFTLGYNNSTGWNQTGSNYVAWNWLANNTSGSSNTDGSITSTVSANTTSGFSIGTYTGNGSAGATIGHGLGSDKVTIIIKRRDTTSNWAVKHYKIPATQWLQLDQTDGANTASVIWNNTEPTSSVFSVGSYVGTNASGGTYVFYAFAEKKGFSKFGSYTGNGSSDGTFVYTGFKPAMLIIKQTNAAGENWYIHDNKRSTYNVTNNLLFPNTSDAESTNNPNASYDFLSNGFKARDSYAGSNASGGSYIYMAFAENPLVGTNNIPATAR